MLVVAGGLLGAAAFSFFTSGYFIRHQAQRLISRATGATVAIGDADLSLGGRLMLRDVRLSAPDMADPRGAEVFRAGSVELNFAWTSMLFGRFAPTGVIVSDPVISLTEDVDRQAFNVAMLRMEGGGQGAQAATLPRIALVDGAFRYGVIEKGQYREVGRAALAGQMVPDARQRGQYQVSVRRVTDGVPQSDSTALSGVFDLSARTADFALRGLRFTEDYRALLPAMVRKQWDQLDPAGRLPEVRFAFDPTEGWRTVVHLADLEMTLPQLGSDDSRFRMTEVRGTLVFAAQRMELKEVVGKIEDLVYQIDGQIDGYHADAPLRLTLRTDEFDIPDTPRYIFALPEPVQKVFRLLTPVGRLRVSMALWRAEPGDRLDYTGTAVISEATGQYHKFAYPLSNCRGLVVFNREALEVKNLTGDTPGGGTVTIAGSIAPPGNEAKVDLVVTAVDLPFDQRLYDAFEAKEQKALDLFFHKPSYQALLDAGHVQPAEQYQRVKAEVNAYRQRLLMLDEGAEAQRLNLQILLSGAEQRLRTPGFSLGGKAHAVVHVKRPLGPGHKYDITVELTLTEASCVFRYFPYPVTVRGGRMVIGGNRVVFEDVTLAGLRGTAAATLKGAVQLPDEQTGQGTRPNLAIAAAGVPVDRLFHDVLGQVLPKQPMAWLERLNAGGTIDIAGRIFTDDHGKPDIDLAIDLARATAAPGKGRYDLRDMSGELGVRLRSMEVRRVGARHGSSRIELNGKADWPDPSSPRVRLVAALRDMRYEDAVLDLLAPFSEAAPLREAWKKHNPAGLFDADVTYRSDRASEPDYTLTMQPRALAFDHQGQRITLGEVTGTVVAEPTRVQLADLAGSFEGGRIHVSGSVMHGEDTEAALRLRAAGPRITPRLRQALPKALRDLLGQLKIEGAYDVDLPTVQLRPRAVKDATVTVKGTVTLAGGSMEAGVPVKDIHGKFDIELTQSPGQAWPTAKLTADVQRMQVLNRPITDFQSVIHCDAARSQLVIPVMRGRCSAGTVGGSGRLGLVDKTYQFRLALSDVDLKELVTRRDPQGPVPPQAGAPPATPHGKPDDKAATGIVKGLVSASLDIEGVWNKPEKLRGRGDVRIRDAVMYDLPLALGMLQITHLSLPVSRSFNRAMMSYYIQNNTVTFERLMIESDATRLSGAGTLGTDTQALDLTLTSSNPGGLNLGPVTELIKGVRDQIITVRITGTLDKPQTKVRQFTGIKQAWDDVWGAKPQPATD